MPIQTNLNVTPYFDDYSENKDYYKVLFKPSVSVQTRELNSLQSMFQKQIERFGDNIFYRGTIVAGCNFFFHKTYPYIKLPDTQLDGSLVDPGSYVGKFVYDEGLGLKAYVVNYADGFELSDPDLKTLYINYINSGTDGNTSQFVPGNNITIYDGSYPVSSVTITNGGTGFSNTDVVAVVPSLLVNVSTGAFSNGDYLINPTTGANTKIINVDSSSVSGKTILYLKPKDADLTNASVNSTAWSYSLYNAVINQTGSAAGIIEKVYGENAQFKITTNSTGVVQTISVLNGGKNYLYAPTVVIKTANSSATVDLLDLDAKIFVAQVSVPAVASAVGNGYAFSITEGVVYQQGHLLRVSPQTIIVSKYSAQPNNVAVGFQTVETIVDATEDESLYEIATGESNEFAPGADRLKLVPTLVKLTKEEAATNTEFFTLVEWNDGNPYKQNQITQYSRIGDSIADNIYDSSGNFLLDAFQVTTESVANSALEGEYYTAVIDPGQGYINGRKVQTLSNYKINLNKGLDTKTANNVVSLNYGNYIRVHELAGNFDFSVGAQITLYDQPVNYLSNSSLVSTGTITPQGAAIGTARIRSVEQESGLPGSASAVYRVYIFDLQMNSGKNFRSVRSLYYNDTYDGIADVILTYDATTNTNIATVDEAAQNSLLFKSGVQSLKNSNTSTYVYRTSDTVNTVISSKSLTVTLSDPNEFFPYIGDLSSAQMQELLVVPVEGDLATANLTGSVNVTSTGTAVTGTGTDFLGAFEIGDYVGVTDGAANTGMRRVTGVVNTTYMTVDSAFAFTDTGLGFYRVFPKNVPVPFGQRSGLYANVDTATEKVLTLVYRDANNTVMDLTFGSAECDTQISYNVERRNVTSASKTSNRNKYVKLLLANNVAGKAGPWCVGVPDIFRLRAVYKANTSTVNATSTDVTSHFYIDHNQNANYLGLGYLYKKQDSNLQLNKNDYLLCCFDYFTRDDAGYYDTVSYLGTANAAQIANIDSMTFGNLSLQSVASTWEVPEVYTYDDKYFDLLNCFDFRPTAANTVSPHETPASAPLNPSATVTFAAHSKFPRPNAVMKTKVEQYLGRIDDIYIAENGSIYVQKGLPATNPRDRYQSNHPKDSLRLQLLNVPPYPNLPKTLRNSVQTIIDTGVSNEKYLGKRLLDHTVSAILNTTNQQTSQPMVYTMEDVATLERRIADLEYYTSLTLLETSITNKIIPSSLDPSLNRFKFGFFADDFSSQIYSDKNNPQYSASIEFEGSDDINFEPNDIDIKPTNRLVPGKRVWSLRHFTENVFYADESIIEQTNATEYVDPCVVTDVNGLTGNAYYTSINRYQSTVYLENLPGVVNLFFDILPGADSLGAKITVYNTNNSIVASSSLSRNDVKTLSTTDINFLSTNDDAETFHNAIITSDYVNTFTRIATSGFEDYGYGTGKMSFSTQGGGKFIIVVDSFDSIPNYKFLVEYPSIEAVGIVNDPACDPNPPVYRGSLEAGKLTIQQWSCSNVFRVNTTGYKAFVLKGKGLKPNTVHKFYMDTEQWGNVVKITNQLYKKSQYEPRRGKKRNRNNPANATKLVLSRMNKVNEVNRFLRLAMKKIGTSYSTLKTDKYGNIEFLVFFPLNIARWFSHDFNALSYRLDYTGYGKGNLGAQDIYGKKLSAPTYGSSGYTSLVLQDATGQSQAARVFANRTPNKTIPDDSRGNI